jgi:hypothetical protein
MRLANGGTGPHERVQNGNICETMLLEKRRAQVVVTWQNSAEQQPTKYGAEALRPPFVDVIDWPVNLLPPAFALRQLRQKFKRERVHL